MNLKWNFAAITAFTLLYSCSNPATSKTDNVSSIPRDTSMVERGRYLVEVIGCTDCHTPKKMTPTGPVPDMDRFLSGYPQENSVGKYDTSISNHGQWVLFKGDLTAAAGPWGLTFAANLTPDETGLAHWTKEQFRKALKEGKYMGLDNSRPIMPPMPVESLSKMTDDDMNAMFAYLKTIKPIKNLVPQAVLNPPPPAK